ncbi:hypothetical protein [Candidatus Tisiphia endosymbiont of Parasteatoda lunata]|uniref:hypothetical protein n=1 Tax=Candidatus Tisiphia endosymbiont of Parasteatoda lunata TaxID=3066275 RepID=UPI00313ED330
MLDLNKEGNKFSSGKGGIRCFEKIFDIGRLAEFIATPGVKGFKATLWGIDKMGIDNFRLLMDAIKKSPIILLNLENNPLTLEMVKEISELTELNLASCNIGDKEIIKIMVWTYPIYRMRSVC